MSSPPEILKSASAEMGHGNYAKAVDILKAGIAENSDNLELWRALSITHQRAKDLPSALSAINQAVEIDKTHISSWVMKGAVHEALQQYREALQAYQCVTDLASYTSDLDPKTAKEVSQVEKRAGFLMGHIETSIGEKLKENGFDPNGEDRRFAQSLDILFGRKPIYFQQPRHMYFPELPQKQFYDKSILPWADALEGRWEVIRDEAKALLGRKELFDPYLQSEDHIPGSDQMDLANNKDWSSFYLIKDGEELPNNQALCPNTAQLLKEIDLCRTGGGTPSVLFSLLQPGAHIPPHTGMLNCRLICHLPLIVPNDCAIRVGNETHEWAEGELVIFDDTIEHEAWNKSDQDRIILLFDVWRPEITEREKKLIDLVLSTR